MAKIAQTRKINHGPKLAHLKTEDQETKRSFFDKKAEVIIWFLLAILFFLVSYLSWTLRPSQVDNLLREADFLYKNGNYPDSYTFLNKAVLLDNSNPSIHFKLAKVYEATNNWTEAQKELLLALELSPNSEVISKELKNVATTTGEPGRIQDEINFWENEVKNKPDFRDGYLQLAVRYFQLYKTTEAKENLNKAFEIDPNFEITRRLIELIK